METIIPVTGLELALIIVVSGFLLFLVYEKILKNKK